MGNNAKYVSAAKPKIAGAIYKAELGTTLPTDATSALDPAFKALGYVSEDGLTNSNSSDTEDIVSWDGDTVLSVEGDKSDKWKFKLLEVLNVDVLKTVYGEENVTGDLDSGITIKANSNPRDNLSWAVDMVMNGGVLKRVVLPNAKISEVADIIYKRKEAVGYETTLSAVPDSEGNTHYEYLAKVSASV